MISRSSKRRTPQRLVLERTGRGRLRRRRPERWWPARPGRWSASRRRRVRPAWTGSAVAVAAATAGFGARLASRASAGLAARRSAGRAGPGPAGRTPPGGAGPYAGCQPGCPAEQVAAAEAAAADPRWGLAGVVGHSHRRPPWYGSRGPPVTCRCSGAKGPASGAAQARGGGAADGRQHGSRRCAYTRARTVDDRDKRVLKYLQHCCRMGGIVDGVALSVKSLASCAVSGSYPG